MNPTPVLLVCILGIVAYVVWAVRRSILHDRKIKWQLDLEYEQLQPFLGDPYRNPGIRGKPTWTMRGEGQGRFWHIDADGRYGRLPDVPSLPMLIRSDQPEWSDAIPYAVDDCDHGVEFDQTVADSGQGLLRKVLSPSEVREKWPRLDGPCPKGCGFHGIAYATHAHYIYGDW